MECSKKLYKKVNMFKDITSLNNFQFHQDYVLAFKQYHIENSIRLPNTSVKVYNSFPTIDIVTSGTTDESVISTKPVKVSSGYEAVASTRTLHDEEICAKLNENKPPRLTGRSDEERNTCSKEWEIRCSLACSVCCL